MQRRECRGGGRANLGVYVCMRGLSRKPKSRSQADFVDGSKKVILNVEFQVLAVPAIELNRIARLCF